ncbi:craniofacial development protein 2-like [Coccinella septempunctata]|uniref:craniofacial development protein 2-like n=1 Tax=Coccinella septempunctata TaxID=41139 RepID=UPI001D078602|nr:craniofacial development protein 2-like [Coccinella septempunctata]
MSASNKENNITDHGSRKPRSGRGGTARQERRASQVVIQRNPCDLLTRKDEVTLKLKDSKKVGTWNVRSLFQAGKVDSVINEMQRLVVDILGCSEVRWPNYGQCRINDHTVYYSGDTSTGNKNGVAIIVNREVERCVLGFIGISDRVAILKVNAKPFNMNIIQTYAPTSESSEQELYEQLKMALNHTKKQELNIIMGDFNAKIGKGTVDTTVGQFGLGTRNDRGDRLIQFCQEVDSAVMNTPITTSKTLYLEISS